MSKTVKKLHFLCRANFLTYFSAFQGTVLKFQDLSVIQILRESLEENVEVPKMPFLAIFGALNFRYG